MAETPQPVKRSAQLTPLSRDHHDGLLLVWKIRQGLKNGTPLNDIAQYVQWFWQHHLQEHFQQEEALLAPRLPADNELLLQMLDEHQNIEGLLHINEQIADEALLIQIADALNDHIRFEERQLFPFAEKYIPVEELNAIHASLSQEKKECPKWENEFWLKK